MVTNITNLMLQEHKEINQILNDLEKNQNKNTLDKLKTLLEKHFFIEEKIIFRIYSLNKSGEDILDLIKEHKDILWIVNKLEIIKELNLELSDLKELLESHIQFETQFFYPNLEKELDIETKNLILDRCKEASCKELDELSNTSNIL